MFSGLQIFVRRLTGQHWNRLSQYSSLGEKDLIDSVQPNPNFFHAFELGPKTDFLVLIARDSLPVSAVIEHLYSIGIFDPLVYRQQDFNTLHIYISLDSFVDTDETIAQLNLWLQRSGFSGSSGDQDPDPPQFVKGPIPLPLQGQFLWLNNLGETVLDRTQISTQQAITTFVSDIANNKNSFQTIREALEVQRKQTDSVSAIDSPDSFPSKSEVKNRPPEAAIDSVTIQDRLEVTFDFHSEGKPHISAKTNEAQKGDRRRRKHKREPTAQQLGLPIPMPKPTFNRAPPMQAQKPLEKLAKEAFG